MIRTYMIAFSLNLFFFSSSKGNCCKQPPNEMRFRAHEPLALYNLDSTSTYHLCFLGLYTYYISNSIIVYF